MRLYELITATDGKINKTQDRKYKRNILKHTKDKDTQARLRKDIVQSQAEEAQQKAMDYLKRLANMQTAPQNA